MVPSLDFARRRCGAITLGILLLVLSGGSATAQVAPAEPPPLLVFEQGETVAGEYFVELDLDSTLQRSSLVNAVATARQDLRHARARGGQGAPLLHPGVLRRSLVASPSFDIHRNGVALEIEQQRRTLSSILGKEIIAHQRHSILVTGFVASLTDSEVQVLESQPGVRSIQPQPRRRPTSDVSAAFLGAPDVWNGVDTGVPARGAGVVLGLMDSGVERLHPSFADVAGVINPLGSGTFIGLCATTPALCNDKLLGLWFCDGTFSEPGDPPCDDAPPVPADPTDDTGHGSHVGSIAVGNEISVGYDPLNPLPDISGIAPLASLISYDVCEFDVCPGLLEGLERALLDGVDVVNISILGTQSPWTSLDSIAARELTAAGVLVVASAGNAGTAGSVTWQEPWVMTVGSSSHTRDRYRATLTPIDGDAVTRPAPMEVITVGAAVGSMATPVEIVYDGTPCGPPAGTYSGEVVACEAGGTFPLNIPTYKADAVRDAGGAAVVALFPTFVPAALPGVIPFSRVSSMADGTALRDWLQAAPGPDGPPKVAITDGELITNPAFGDVVSNFSSRGPVADYDLIKPDIVAPGHFILAADYADGHFGEPPTDIHVQRRQGTSMASPQVAGAATLLLELNPALSPPQVKSILQTTAVHSDLLSCTDVIFPYPCATPASPGDFFDFGAGRLAVAQAPLAGLALDETDANFLAADPAMGGDPATLNIATMAKRDCPAGCAFTRTVDSLTTANVTWSGQFTSVGGAPVNPPNDLEFHLVPSTFDLASPAQQTFAVGVYATDVGVEDTWQQALLELVPSDVNVPTARLPIAVMPTDSSPDSDLEVVVTASPPFFTPGDPVTFTITVSNLGTVAAVGVAVDAAEPADVAATSWSCLASGSSLCGTSAGTGALADTAAVFPGSSVVYTYTVGDTSGFTANALELLAGLTPPSGLMDLVSANNSDQAASSNADFLIFADGFESGDTAAWQ